MYNPFTLDFEKTITIIKTEWKMITNAPILFAISVLIIGTMIYFINRYYFKREINALRAEASLKESHISFLNERYDAKKIQLEEIIESVKSKESVQAENNNVQNDSIRAELSFEIDQILKKLQNFWEKYQKNGKDSWRYGGTIISKSPLTTTPARFKNTFPELNQGVLKNTQLIEVREFYYKIEDIEFIYKELRNRPKQDFELTFQWEELVADVLKQGNPLKEKP